MKARALSGFHGFALAVCAILASVACGQTAGDEAFGADTGAADAQSFEDVSRDAPSHADAAIVADVQPDLDCDIPDAGPYVLFSCCNGELCRGSCVNGTCTCLGRAGGCSVGELCCQAIWSGCYPPESLGACMDP